MSDKPLLLTVFLPSVLHANRSVKRKQCFGQVAVWVFGACSIALSKALQQNTATKEGGQRRTICNSHHCLYIVDKGKPFKCYVCVLVCAAKEVICRCTVGADSDRNAGCSDRKESEIFVDIHIPVARTCVERDRERESEDRRDDAGEECAGGKRARSR